MTEPSVEDIVARIEEAKPYRHLGSRVIMPSDELDALIDSWRALKAEREACAKIAESFMDGSSHATLVAGTIAAAIRARTP